MASPQIRALVGDLRLKMQSAHDRIAATSARAETILAGLAPKLDGVDAAFAEIDAMGVEAAAFVAEIAQGVPPLAGVPLGPSLSASLAGSEAVRLPDPVTQTAAANSQPMQAGVAAVAAALGVTGTMENTPIGAVFRPDSGNTPIT